MTIVVEQTNLYACQVLGEKAEADWTNGNKSAFGNLCIYWNAAFMGVNQLPALAHCW